MVDNGVQGKPPTETRLRTDADPILDHVERFFGHDIFGHKLAFHFIWAIADNPVGDLLRQPQQQDHFTG